PTPICTLSLHDALPIWPVRRRDPSGAAAAGWPGGRGRRPATGGGMLAKEENELLTRTDPGTPGGALLRCYWQPVALAEELPPGGDRKSTRLNSSHDQIS